MNRNGYIPFREWKKIIDLEEWDKFDKWDIWSKEMVIALMENSMEDSKSASFKKDTKRRIEYLKKKLKEG